MIALADGSETTTQRSCPGFFTSTLLASKRSTTDSGSPSPRRRVERPVFSLGREVGVSAGLEEHLEGPELPLHDRSQHRRPSGAVAFVHVAASSEELAKKRLIAACRRHPDRGHAI